MSNKKSFSEHISDTILYILLIVILVTIVVFIISLCHLMYQTYISYEQQKIYIDSPMNNQNKDCFIVESTTYTTYKRLNTTTVSQYSRMYNNKFEAMRMYLLLVNYNEQYPNGDSMIRLNTSITSCIQDEMSDD